MLEGILITWMVGSVIFLVYAAWKTFKQGIFPRGHR